jgi:hypothetical protein
LIPLYGNALNRILSVLSGVDVPDADARVGSIDAFHRKHSPVP